MQQVEIIRQRIVRGQASELMRLRTFLSMTEGNIDAVAKLEGDHGNRLLGRVTEYILRELGHRTEIEDRAQSKAARAAKRLLHIPKGA